MRALRVVGITEGSGELSVVLEDSSRHERFTVPADEQLRAAARGDLTRLGQIAIELESQLRPREIQARIRAGASVEQVAAAAGWPPQKIERFAYPVLLERSRTAEVAQRAHPMRADGPDSRVLADVVAHTFGLRGQEYLSAEWDSWKGEDGRWVVALSWRAGRSDNRALWTFQPGAHGGTVTAIDEHAHDLVEGLPARPLRTVGPVIDISRPDEQPPPVPEEGHELRAAASDIAARRDVSDWSRTAPEPRRPESPRRSAPSARQEPVEALSRSGRTSEPFSRPEPSAAVARTRPDPADEPATDWPVAQRDTEIRADKTGDSEIRADDSARLGDTTKRDADTAAPAQAPTPISAPASTSAPAPTPISAPASTSAPAPTPISAPASTSAPAPNSAPAPTPTRAPIATQTAAPTTQAPTRTVVPTTPAPTQAPAPNPAPAAAPTPAAAPAPAGEPVAVAETPVSAETPAEAEAAPEAPQVTVDDPPSPEAAREASAPREAEAEPAAGPPAPKRSRKGKPVMPSWDEVLLGVRSQR